MHQLPRSGSLASYRANPGGQHDDSASEGGYLRNWHTFRAVSAVDNFRHHLISRSSWVCILRSIGGEPSLLPREISDRRTEILDLADRFGVTDIRVFGSQARGTATQGSDVDFVVHVRPRRSLLDLLSFEAAVEALLGCPVDVVSDRGLAPAIYQEIRRECIPL